jgi:transketolase
MAEMGLVDIHHSVVETEATNKGYDRGLIELAERGVDMIVMDADLAGSSGTSEFRGRFPERFMDIGLCEQDMIGTAAGLALADTCVFVTTHGMLAAGKAWDTIRSTICYGSLNVVLCGADAGLSASAAGGSRQSLEDVAVMRTLPGMTVLVPTDSVEAKKATLASARIPGPVYIRFAAARTPIITTAITPFTVGEAEVYRQGDDVSVLASGVMVYEALKAARMLEDEGLGVRVINCHTVKPLDRAMVNRASVETGALVTAEEGSRVGGLGGAVAEALAQMGRPTPMRIVGVDDRFGESGEHQELLAHFGLTSRGIASAIRDVVLHKQMSVTGGARGPER